MPLKEDPSKILPTLKARLQGSKTRAEVKEIVKTFFSREGTELRYVTPSDWKANPAIFSKIKDPNYVSFAKMINGVWKILTREMLKEVKEEAPRYSLIYSSRPFVVPGGRFREFYYWDTYWVVKGLLLSDMPDTVRGMLLNFIDLVKAYGFVPNGGRKYYLNRSQPPFLTLMVKLYYSSTKDVQFVKRAMDYLEREYSFWMTNRSIVVGPSQGVSGTHTLNVYSTPMGSPRPESYWQDVETMKQAGFEGNKEKQQELYAHIASAAESGWDFSSRWFKHGPNAWNMTSIQTREIVPVDLNSILCGVEKTLADFSQIIGDPSKKERYQKAFEKRKAAVESVFWDKGYGQWLDYNLGTNSRNKGFYASNIYPLWAGCYENSTQRSEMVIESLKELGIFNYVAGIPTSLNHSEQQWDYPNAWPPLQQIMEEALRESGTTEGKKLAFELAKKWLETNYISWKETGHMYEKFDVNIKGKPGHGGEYDVQVGFGWSNGVVLDFLARYGKQLKAPNLSNANSTCQYSYIFTMSILLILTLKFIL